MDSQNKSDTHSQENDANQPVVCQIRIKGHLNHQWAEWFGGLSIIQEADGTTLLTGPVVDQAALHGILKQIRNLGMPLLSVNYNRTGPGETPESN